MNTKAKGSRRERQTIAMLESFGFLCTRAAGSLGVFDIIAQSEERDLTLNVQVKSNNWPGSEETQRIEKFPVPSQVVKLLVRWDDSKGGRGNKIAPDMRAYINGEWITMKELP